MKGADKVVCLVAAVFLLSTLSSAPAKAQLGGFGGEGGGEDMMTQMAPMLEMMKAKMGKRRFAQLMQTMGPMMEGGGGGMMGGDEEQQLVDFVGKIGAVAHRRNHTALGINADGNDNAATSLRAIADVANNFPTRQAAVLGEIVLQPFRKCRPCAS